MSAIRFHPFERYRRLPVLLVNENEVELDFSYSPASREKVRVKVEKEMAVNTKTKNLVQYLTSVRLSEKGQLVLPKEYRSEQKLESGAPITVLRIGNGLLLLPEMQKFNALCDSIERTLINADVTSDLQTKKLKILQFLTIFG